MVTYCMKKQELMQKTILYINRNKIDIVFNVNMFAQNIIAHLKNKGELWETAMIPVFAKLSDSEKNALLNFKNSSVPADEFNFASNETKGRLVAFGLLRSNGKRPTTFYDNTNDFVPLYYCNTSDYANYKTFTRNMFKPFKWNELSQIREGNMNFLLPFLTIQALNFDKIYNKNAKYLPLNILSILHEEMLNNMVQNYNMFKISTGDMQKAKNNNAKIVQAMKKLKSIPPTPSNFKDIIQHNQTNHILNTNAIRASAAIAKKSKQAFKASENSLLTLQKLFSDYPFKQIYKPKNIEILRAEFLAEMQQIVNNMREKYKNNNSNSTKTQPKQKPERWLN